MSIILWFYFVSTRSVVHCVTCVLSNTYLLVTSSSSNEYSTFDPDALTDHLRPNVSNFNTQRDFNPPSSYKHSSLHSVGFNQSSNFNSTNFDQLLNFNQSPAVSIHPVPETSFNSSHYPSSNSIPEPSVQEELEIPNQSVQSSSNSKECFNSHADCTRYPIPKDFVLMAIKSLGKEGEKILTEGKNNNGIIPSNLRYTLCQALVSRHNLYAPSRLPTKVEFLEFTKQIVQLFPGEKAAVYYIPFGAS